MRATYRYSKLDPEVFTKIRQKVPAVITDLNKIPSTILVSEAVSYLDKKLEDDTLDDPTRNKY